MTSRNQIGIDVSPIHDNGADVAPIFVLFAAICGYGFSGNQRPQALLCAIAIWLPRFRGVNVGEPDFVLRICRVEDGQRVAIGDTNNPAGDFVGERIIDKQYEQKCKDLPFHN